MVGVQTYDVQHDTIFLEYSAASDDHRSDDAATDDNESDGHVVVTSIQYETNHHSTGDHCRTGYLKNGTIRG